MGVLSWRGVLVLVLRLVHRANVEFTGRSTTESGCEDQSARRDAQDTGHLGGLNTHLPAHFSPCTASSPLPQKATPRPVHPAVLSTPSTSPTSSTTDHLQLPKILAAGSPSRCKACPSAIQAFKRTKPHFCQWTVPNRRCG